MVIDLIFAVLMVLALVQGYRRGLIVALFSYLAIIIGLAAALKLSVVVSKYIGHSVKVSDKWLPILSFVAVFIVVVLLVRLGAKAIQRLTETLLLGWANRLGGIIFYAAIYTTIFSILLFYSEQINIVKPGTIRSSVTYSFIRPWGPKAMDILSALIPFFKDMFGQLERFFGGISEKVSSAS